MSFSSLNDVIHMGGHGLYVWLSYGAGVAILSYNLVAPKMKQNALMKRLSQQLKREKLAK
ncbi:heme exporter protein CcmD [Hahella sp. CCB-MM4]|uniref:heme exporter protein CcmD n=1 Tax=Hahella sp. (strain CCB-MM4) TaxID=1926491 RepID=UPI000B9A4625|nr:heme exporter protein CcmD [Hahella sp. CCB-MM4]OZG71046.1 heme exporter protein CcmD [Hahella sp. CCB-MM4]